MATKKTVFAWLFRQHYCFTVLLFVPALAN